jgi:hypothetical protein
MKKPVTGDGDGLVLLPSSMGLERRFHRLASFLWRLFFTATAKRSPLFGDLHTADFPPQCAEV